jgi:hypothetical protein
VTTAPAFAPSGSYSGTVKVQHQIFRAEDDGYAVIEVLDEGSGGEPP